MAAAVRSGAVGVIDVWVACTCSPLTEAITTCTPPSQAREGSRAGTGEPASPRTLSTQTEVLTSPPAVGTRLMSGGEVLACDPATGINLGPTSNTEVPSSGPGIVDDIRAITSTQVPPEVVATEVPAIESVTAARAVKTAATPFKRGTLCGGRGTESSTRKSATPSESAVTSAEATSATTETPTAETTPTKAAPPEVILSECNGRQNDDAGKKKEAFHEKAS
ncbi:MAG: hypothetical protein U0903_20620 [Planctomycetales bacterium]